MVGRISRSCRQCGGEFKAATYREWICSDKCRSSRASRHNAERAERRWYDIDRERRASAERMRRWRLKKRICAPDAFESVSVPTERAAR